VTEWVFEVVVQTDTHDHAEEAVLGRLDYDEDYGFDYRIWMRGGGGKPSQSESAKGISRMYAAAHNVEAILGILDTGRAKIESVAEGDDYVDVTMIIRVMGADDRIKPTVYKDDGETQQDPV